MDFIKQSTWFSIQKDLNLYYRGWGKPQIQHRLLVSLEFYKRWDLFLIFNPFIMRMGHSAFNSCYEVRSLIYYFLGSLLRVSSINAGEICAELNHKTAYSA
jgi:hypothetical protein